MLSVRPRPIYAVKGSSYAYFVPSIPKERWCHEKRLVDELLRLCGVCYRSAPFGDALKGERQGAVAIQRR